MILSDDQIAERAQVHVNEKFSLHVPAVELEDTRKVESTVGECKIFCQNDYTSGWKDCTEYYRELIEAGIANSTPIDKVSLLAGIVKAIQILHELSDEDMEEILDRIIHDKKKDNQIKQMKNGQ